MLAIVSAPPIAELDMWDCFWTLYPRKEARKAALRAWSKIDPKIYPQIITSIASWRPILAERGETRYIPLPASWLNDERWEDEIPAELKIARPSSHVPFKADGNRTERGEIPDSVKLMIARLKR